MKKDNSHIDIDPYCEEEWGEKLFPVSIKTLEKRLLEEMQWISTIKKYNNTMSPYLAKAEEKAKDLNEAINILKEHEL